MHKVDNVDIFAQLWYKLIFDLLLWAKIYVMDNCIYLDFQNANIVNFMYYGKTLIALRINGCERMLSGFVWWPIKERKNHFTENMQEVLRIVTRSSLITYMQ